MANRTVKDANSIHGTNPQYLVEKIIRTRIYDSRYWKEECFALTAELLVDKAMELRSIGGVYSGNIKPTPFLCLLLKMLQIQPEKDIVIEFIKQDEFKYVRALGAFYFRLVYGSLDCYKYLEPLLNDYRKMRLMDRNGQYHLIHMDEYIDCMMREERYCDIIFPRIQKRWVHEECNDLEARVSLLDDDLEDLESDSEEEEPPPPPPTRAKAEEIGSRSGGRMDRHIRDSHYPPLPLDPGRGDHDKGREKRRRSRDRTNNDRSRMERDQRKRHRHRSPQDHRHRPERDSRDHRDREARDHRRGGGDVASRHRGHEKERQPRREKGHRNGAKDHKSISSKRSRVKDDSNVDVEVAQANALRAELGLPPLRM